MKLLVAAAAKDLVALGRFRREALVTSALGHPHIVEVIDSNVTAEGRPYLVMELLEGEDLGTRIDRDGAMGLAQVASVVRQVTSALHAAHEMRVVHRDLKPENVFLCRRGALDDYVKLLDFGISKVFGSKTVETMPRTLVGSPCYMSPEQADERVADVDARTDVYAVGTMIFEMLAGVPPFEAGSLPSLLYKIVHVDPPDIRAIRPDIPEPLVQVISIAMQKEPDLRYPGSEALWIAFSEAVEASLGQVEKTTISHTSWPGHPELPANAPVAQEPRPPRRPVLGRSTTRSASAGELRPGSRRRPLVLVAASGGLLLLSLLIVLALHSGDSPPARLPAIVPPVADGPTVRTPLKVAAAMGQKPVLADIFLDGCKVGQSPAVLRGLPPGRHVVEARRSGRSRRRVVELRSGQTMSVVVHLG